MSVYRNENLSCIRPPKLYIWAREVLFLGTGPARQKPRRATQEKLVVALNGRLGVRTPDGRKANTRSCVIPSGLWIDPSVLDAGNAVVAIYHIAPFSQDYAALAHAMKPGTSGIHYDHPDEDNLVRTAVSIRDGKFSAPAARARFRDTLLPVALASRRYRSFDPRVVHVARLIRDSIFDNITLSELAEEVQLSCSRLEKLFKEQAGLPITQYRMRYRIFLASILIAAGHSMTDAALMAGFSNSAHLSRSYRALNGMTPSEMFARPPYVQSIIDDSALAVVAPLMDGTIAV